MNIEQALLDLFLKQNKTPLSGETIAQSLGLSRTAVWNHIRRLRDQGYEIDARSNVGYILKKTPDRFIPEELKVRLKTKKFAQHLICLDQIDSTNDLACQMAEEGTQEGTLILAEKQLKGRGRQGRQWDSAAYKGIWASLILKPKIHPSKASQLTYLAALALVRSIKKETGLDAAIKWPNDVLISGKKVSGILSEMRSEPDQIHYLVLGIGVNINQIEKDFPKSIQRQATSLQLELGKPVSRVHFLSTLLEELEDLYEKVLVQPEQLVQQVKSVCQTLGKKVEITRDETSLKGKAVDLDSSGALVLLKENGEIEKVYSGELCY